MFKQYLQRSIGYAIIFNILIWLLTGVGYLMLTAIDWVGTGDWIWMQDNPSIIRFLILVGVIGIFGAFFIGRIDVEVEKSDEPEEMNPRQEIADFTKEMEWAMASNDEEKGDSWKKIPMSELRKGLENKINERRDGRIDKSDIFETDRDREMSELVDEANYNMMLYTRLEAGRGKLDA